jgi:hypothetical protein
MEARLVSTEARWLLAALYIEQGRQERAERLLEELVPDAIQLPVPAARLAVAEARAGQRAEALDRLAEARERFPDSPVLDRARAMIDREKRPGD